MDNQSADLEAAKRCLDFGNVEKSLALAERILEKNPEHLEATNILALCFLGQGEPRRCIALLEQATQANPSDPLTRKNLGCAYGKIGELASALAQFEAAVHLQPSFYVARLHLGDTLEKSGRSRDALHAYFRAITDAQLQGRCTNAITTPEALRPLVRHAIEYSASGRRTLLEEIIAPLKAAYGEEALDRVSSCIATYLGELPPRYQDPRQRPSFLHFPDLPTTTYFARELFPWMESLEACTDVIGAELRNILPSSTGHEMVFDAALAKQGLSNPTGTATWDGFYFYRHGQRKDENHRRCPATAAALEALPLVKIREHAPEIMFSVLSPGTHILPHRGVTNTRAVLHLPLVVPENCALNVGGELHRWEEGRGIVFDDTFEHEAWNRSEHTRVVLIADIWNPYLTAVERAAIVELVSTIGDFNRDAHA